MGIERGGGFSCGWSTAAAKPCDSCKSGAAAMFCSGHSAFLCLSCDAKIHGCDNKLASPSRHERVWICEVCQQAPAAVTCKADAASLCFACDADIHSAHPLAQRHERVPVEPFFDSTESMIKSAAALNFLVPTCNNNGISDDKVNGSEPAQWLLMNSNLSNSNIMEDQDTDVNFSEISPFLDFEYQYGIDVKFHQQHNENEGVVPAPAIDYATENYFDIDFPRSKLTSFSYATQSLSQSVSSTSVDFRVVPDGNGNSMSDMTSYSFEKNVNGVVPNVPTTSTTVSNQIAQFCGMDREARVLRYREKRKNRKFEKTIRYASRKAYAETRPRIKGRFAKRKEIETEVDDCVSSVPDLCSVLSPANYFFPCGLI